MKAPASRGQPKRKSVSSSGENESNGDKNDKNDKDDRNGKNDITDKKDNDNDSDVSSIDNGSTTSSDDSDDDNVSFKRQKISQTTETKGNRMGKIVVSEVEKSPPPYGRRVLLPKPIRKTKSLLNISGLNIQPQRLIFQTKSFTNLVSYPITSTCAALLPPPPPQQLPPISQHQQPQARVAGPPPAPFIPPPPLSFEQKQLQNGVRRLIHAPESEVFAILDDLSALQQAVTFDRFQTVLRGLKEEAVKRDIPMPTNFRPKRFYIIKTMLLFLPLRIQDFILFILEETICGGDRLNAVVSIQYFGVTEWIMASVLFDENPNNSAVQRAVVNYPVKSVIIMLKFLAANSARPDVIRERLVREECFRNLFNPDLTRCTEEKIRDFINLICKRLKIEVPREASDLFARIARVKEIAVFHAGEVEVEDFRQIVLSISDGDDDLYDYCVRYMAPINNPITKSLCQYKGLPFAPSPHADFFVPGCTQPYGPRQHELAHKKSHIFQDLHQINEFKSKLEESELLTITVKTSPTDDDKEKTPRFILFNCLSCIFIYGRRHSDLVRDELTEILGAYAQSKRIFALNADAVSGFLRRELNWVPNSITDAADVATRIGVDPCLSGITGWLTGEAFCGRANHASDVGLPTSQTMAHMKMRCGIIHEFCVSALGLRWAKIRENNETARKRKASREGQMPKSKRN